MEGASEYEDPKLRDHVRSLLLEYALQHIATDYIEYTENLFEQLISGYLTQISEFDPSSLRLPVDIDPLQKFLHEHDVNSLTFDEKLQINQHIVNYVKRYTKVPSRNRAEEAALNDAYESVTPTYRPPTPVLSRKARMETPRLGELKKGPSSTSEVALTYALQPVEVHAIPEPTLELSPCLDVKHQLAAHELEPVRSLIKSSQSNPANHCNSWLDPRRSPSPPQARPRSPSPFTPLFSRLECPGNGQPPPRAGNVPHMMADLPGLSHPPASGEEDVEAHISNMVVVDGWSALRSSPSALTTPSASQEDDRLDQLFETSTPPTDPQPLFETMDIVMFPRSARLHGKSPSQRPLGSEKRSLSAFIMPLISAQGDGTTPVNELVRTPDSAPASSPPNFSVVGAPPSPVGRKDRLRRLLGDEQLSLDIASQYRTLKEQPSDLIMKDKPDDKAHLLMDVPELPPPTEHPEGGLLIPRKFDQLLPPPKSDKKPKVIQEFLKRAKGLPSLNTTLSWRLFKSDAMLLTRDEACGAATLFDPHDFDDASLESMNAQVQTLFSEACILGAHDTSKDIWDDGDHRLRVKDMIDDDLWRGDILLTREERWRRAGYAEPVEELTEPPPETLPNEVERPPKRLRTATTAAHPETAQTPLNIRAMTVDDSGIVLPDALALSHDNNTDGAQDEDTDLPGVRFAAPENNSTDSVLSNPALLHRSPLAPGHATPDDFPDSATSILPTHFDESLRFPAQLGDGLLDEDQHSHGQHQPFYYDDEDKENMPHLIQGTYSEISSLDYVEDDISIAWSPGAPSIDYAIPQEQPTLPSNALQLTFKTRVSQPRALGEDEDESQLSLITPDPDYPGGSQFVPLSFDSLHPATSHLSQSRARDGTAAVDLYMDDLPGARDNSSIGKTSENGLRDPVASTHFATSHVAAAEPEIANRSLGIFDFALLRAKKVTAPPPPPPPVESRPATPEQPREPPADIYDANTLRLPSTWTIPATVHRYLASMDCVQKQALMRGLRSQECAIDIVERDDLGGVDLIIDPHTAVLLVSLLSLPGACVDAVARIVAQTWNFDRLLVILEAYPASYAKKIERRGAAPYAYTPPVLKALQKLRRDLVIEQACGSSREATAVRFAFADTVSEAALFVRMLGNEAEGNDQAGGVLWGGREWLDDEPYEGEMDLASVKGMNVFAAVVMLCQEGIELQEVLDMSGEQRLDVFGPFVGRDRVAGLNAFLLERRQQVEGMSALNASSELLASRH